MLTVEVPNFRIEERRYVIDVVLRHFLGLAYQLEIVEGDYVIIRDASCAEPQIILDDSFFRCAHQDWLGPDYRRALVNAEPSGRQPSVYPDTCGPAVLFGQTPPTRAWLSQSAGRIEISLDIFGSIFFMLTRYEEIVQSERDRFDRFPAAAALLTSLGLLGQPVVDEYTEVLWNAISALWPGLQRRQRHFQCLLSHDVDLPLKHGFSPLPRTLLAALRDLTVGGFGEASKRLQVWRAVQNGHTEEDPYNTFDYLMRHSECRGLRSAFYFIADHTSRFDGLYRINHPWILALIKSISERGHEIGLHPSFNTYRDAEQTAREFSSLRQVCDEAGVNQHTWGGRQHYLRWSNPHTWNNWQAAGLNYDSTLGFADHIGFRCGTCHDYPAFDLVAGKALSLIVRPLMVMDATVFGMMGLGLGTNALDAVLEIKRQCRRVQGNFTLLWHNSNLCTAEQRRFYESLLDA